MENLRKMKKNKIFILVVFILLCLSAVIYSSYTITTYVFAGYDENSDYNTVESVFGDSGIKHSEYLYSLDDNSDYVYVSFTDGGYAVLSSAGGDLLERADKDVTGYQKYITAKKYYAGPGTYYAKENGKLYDTITDTVVEISTGDAEKISRQIRDTVLSSDQSRNIKIQIADNQTSSAPDYDKDNLIHLDSEDMLIDNYEYFRNTPKFGNNVHGTCGSVAAQLFLSYHNFYNDRRIIAPEYLNGGWTNTLGDGDIFNAQNYKYPNRDPNVCENPYTTDYYAIGSNDEFYKYIIGKIEPGALRCNHTETGEPCTHKGSSRGGVINGMKEILDDRIGTGSLSYVMLSGEVYGNKYFHSRIKEELDYQHPVIISMSERLGGTNHWVVGYGYSEYAYEDGGTVYDGYITHFGWSPGSSVFSDVWVNQSWCDSYISLSIAHKHIYSIDTERDFNERREVRCNVCGHRALDDIYNTDESGAIITGAKHRISGNVTLPNKINGKTIKGIGTDAFKNNNRISAVTFPRSITAISGGAFNGCTDLRSVYDAERVKTIGSRAFYNCSKLQEVEFSDRLQAIDAEAFYGCTSLKDIDFTNVTAIGDYAFYRCANLNKIELKSAALRSVGKFAFYGCTGIQTLRIDEDVVVNDYAFGECGGLEDVYFYDLYRTPDLEKDCFPVRDFVVHIPHGMTAAYKEIFAPYTQDFADIYTTVNYWVLGGVKRTENVLYGEYLTLGRMSADGCRFAGWYTDPEFAGSRITGISVNEKEVLDIYARQVSLSDLESFAERLGSIADYYVQDAYASVEKRTLSIVDIPRYYQEREAIYAGAWLYRDIKFGKYTETPPRPYIVMSGSVNTTIEDELRYIYDRINVCDKIYVVGQAAQAFYAARGIGFGNNENLPEETINFAGELLEMAKHYGKELIIPNVVCTTNQDMSAMILRSAYDIPADEIPLWFYMPELSDVYSSAKTLEMRGYPLLCSDNTLISFMRKSTDSEFRNMIDAYYSYPTTTYVAIFGDYMKLTDPGKPSYYTENNDRCNFDSGIFKVLEVGGDTLDDISAIFDCEDLRDKTVLMRVECNVGDINRCDESKLRECLLNMSPSIRFMGQNGCRNLILMANNRYDPTRWAAKESHEFNNKRLLEMSAQIFGVEEVGFARFGEELEKSVADGRYFDFNIIWTENLYAYETTYDAFPSV